MEGSGCNITDYKFIKNEKNLKDRSESNILFNKNKIKFTIKIFF